MDTISPSITTPQPPEQEPVSLAPTPAPEITESTPVVAIEVTEDPLPTPSTSIPKEQWTIDTTSNPLDNLVLTTQPAEEPSTLEPIENTKAHRDLGPEPYTQEPLTEPPWFPKMYMIIDSTHYINTGNLRVLSAVGNALSVEDYRPRDMGQAWFTNFKGYVKSASTNGLLTSQGECVSPGLTDSIGNAVMWNFKKTEHEREYEIVAQCGRKLHVPSGTFTVGLDPIGSPWYIIPVARVEF
jgi:hypothetical protein